jgi:hypothetical protein
VRGDKGVLLRRGRLILIGFVSEAVYLVAVWRLSWWSYGGRLWSWAEILGRGNLQFWICLAGIGVLLVAYFCGWRVVRQGGGKRWVIWSFAGVFALTLFWLQPITSDLFSSLSRAHLFTDLGGNPLLDAPLDYGDALVRAYPTVYATRPMVYGPAWLLFSAPGTLGRPDVAAGLIYLKGLAVVAYLGCAWLLERILQRLRPVAAIESLYLFAWNPLVLLMAVGDGHNDIVMMALALLALWLLVREHWVSAFGVLTLSIWVKYASGILFPLFALYAWRRAGHEQGHRRWTVATEAGLVAASISCLLFAPFGGLARVTGLVERLLWPVNWRSGAAYPPALALLAGLGVFAIAFTVLVWWVMRGDLSLQQIGNACFFASLLAFLLGAARSQPWHLIWPVALAGVSDRRWAWPVVAGMSTLMLAVELWVEWVGAGVSPLS